MRWLPGCWTAAVWSPSFKKWKSALGCTFPLPALSARLNPRTPLERERQWAFDAHGQVYKETKALVCTCVTAQKTQRVKTTKFARDYTNTNQTFWLIRINPGSSWDNSYFWRHIKLLFVSANIKDRKFSVPWQLIEMLFLQSPSQIKMTFSWKSHVWNGSYSFCLGSSQGCWERENVYMILSP